MADTDEGQKPGTDPTMTHPQCINRLKDIERALSEITEVDEPSAEDQKYFDELTEEFRTVNAYRIKLERRAQLAKVQSVSENLSAARHLKVERGMKQALGGYGQGSMDDYDVDSILEPDSVEQKRFRNPWDLSQMRTFDRNQQDLTREYRARALSAVETMQGATDRIRSAATDIIERWGDEDGKLDRLILGLSDPDYFRAWSKMARDPRAADLDEAERRSVTRVSQLARAMSLTDAAGGYLVPFQLDPTVIITANGSATPARSSRSVTPGTASPLVQSAGRTTLRLLRCRTTARPSPSRASRSTRPRGSSRSRSRRSRTRPTSPRRSGVCSPSARTCWRPTPSRSAPVPVCRPGS
jgi:hypothetical protein